MVGLILAMITCNISYAQEAPQAAPDEASTFENTPVTINVLENDTDADSDIDPTSVDLDPEPGIQSTVETPKGTFTADPDGVVNFTPATGAEGPAAASYAVSDLAGNVSNRANINVTIETVNAAPVAADDAATVVENREVEINALANDSDSDGTLDTSKVDLNLTQPGINKSAETPLGRWTVNKGVVKFKPKADYVGTATLEYVVYDNENAASNPATITVTVTSSNVAPVAANDTGGTTLNKPVTVNVVANDTDSDGTIDPSKVDLNITTAGVQNTANTAQGSWAVNAQGVVSYSPIALFLGTASLSYTVMDNEGATSNAATLTITVQALNIAPVAVNDNVTTAKNVAVTISVTQNDGDVDGTIDVTKVDLNPTLAGIQTTKETIQGNYVVNIQGVVTYTPANNFTGVAATTYNVADNAGAISNTASINITVQNVNSAPVAVDDTGATGQNDQVTVNVVANDTDSDGVIDAAKVDLNPSLAGIQDSRSTPQGNFTVNNIGIVTYKPKKDFTGSVTTEYTVSDNNAAVSNIATITIAVQPANAPIAVEDVAATKTNEAVEIDVVANDRDEDGSIDAATVDLDVTADGEQKDKATPEGTYEVNAEGVVTYTPAKDFTGDVELSYTVKDNKGVLSNPALIRISVEAVPNVAPEIVAFESETDTLRYTPGNPMPISDLFEARDADDDSLAVAEIGFVSEFYALGKDKLTFNTTKKIDASFDEQTGLLTLTGAALIEDYNEAIRNVKYEYSGASESKENIKRIYVRVSDGNDFSEPVQRSVMINSALSEIDIPTAFTPNSDGANDTWRILAPGDISGSDFADAEIRVYDKRGTVVFGTNGLETSWDGTYQGKQLPVDTYYYTIDLKQQQKRYKGIVAILR